LQSNLKLRKSPRKNSKNSQLIQIGEAQPCLPPIATEKVDAIFRNMPAMLAAQSLEKARCDNFCLFETTVCT
jgi:hypothetical protein